MSGRKLSYRPRFANKKVINPHPVRRVVAVQKVGATISKWQRPKTHEALAIVRPDTVVRWHRAGFRCYWRWISRSRPGRPAVPAEIRQLIRQMSVANPLWGAPRIHGELLKLGIDIGQTSVAKYRSRRRGPPSQGWKTFLRNHAHGVAAMDASFWEGNSMICRPQRTRHSAP